MRRRYANPAVGQQEGHNRSGERSVPAQRLALRFDWHLLGWRSGWRAPSSGRLLLPMTSSPASRFASTGVSFLRHFADEFPIHPRTHLGGGSSSGVSWLIKKAPLSFAQRGFCNELRPSRASFARVACHQPVALFPYRAAPARCARYGQDPPLPICSETIYYV